MNVWCERSGTWSSACVPRTKQRRELPHYVTVECVNPLDRFCFFLPARTLASAALARNLGAFLSRLGQPDRDCLFAALNPLAASTRFKSSLLASAHRALDALGRCFAVSLTARRFSCRHVRSPSR